MPGRGHEGGPRLCSGSTRRPARPGAAPGADDRPGAAPARSAPGSPGSRSRAPARRWRARGRLPLAQLARGGRLDDVVDPSAAAADVLLARLDDLQRGIAAQRRAVRGRQRLRVPQMARVLVGDPQRRADAGARAEPRRAARRRRSREAVVLQVRAAARGVDGDGVEAGEVSPSRSVRRSASGRAPRVAEARRSSPAAARRPPSLRPRARAPSPRSRRRRRRIGRSR